MDTFARWRDLAYTFPDREFVVQELAKPMASGRLLTVHHFIELASITDAKNRAKLLTRIRKDSWSVSDLRNELVATGARGSARRGPGRSMNSPKSPAAGLHRFSILTGQLVKYCPLMGESVFEAILGIEADKVPEKVFESIQEAKTVATEATKSLHQVLERLQEIEDYLRPNEYPDEDVEEQEDVEDDFQNDGEEELEGGGDDFPDKDDFSNDESQPKPKPKPKQRLPQLV